MKALKPFTFVLLACSLASTAALAQAPAPSSTDAAPMHKHHPFGERRWNSAPEECVGPSGYCVPYFGS
ncbi:hypothetical protein [Caballeronia sp. LZ035]|uniref:hypothetical protein n=1 Tax=Caballeronia sp. LZ035 TaxID=3038568 RepID=UPI002859A50D|nr:hypothetical protein [Caballeronia sp. LZ035]MDR5760841.1 hypothetical protein [Caballeronia sp. LZ035]